MITRKFNIEKLFEEMGDLPIIRIDATPNNLYDDDGNFVEKRMSINPIINPIATEQEIKAIWQVIGDHVYTEPTKSTEDFDIAEIQSKTLKDAFEAIAEIKKVLLAMGGYIDE